MFCCPIFFAILSSTLVNTSLSHRAHHWVMHNRRYSLWLFGALYGVLWKELQLEPSSLLNWSRVEIGDQKQPQTITHLISNRIVHLIIWVKDIIRLNMIILCYWGQTAPNRFKFRMLVGKFLFSLSLDRILKYCSKKYIFEKQSTCSCQFSDTDLRHFGQLQKMLQICTGLLTQSWR